MDLDKRITTFVKLGEALQQKDDHFQLIAQQAFLQNGWFTPENIEKSVNAIAENYLNEENLRNWIEPYREKMAISPKTIGLIMAGNIPLAGFHDLLTVLISGNIALTKLSSKDTILIPYIKELLQSIESDLAAKIIIAGQLKDMDAIIATGSNNSSRYFEYYFGNHPHIIRKNRGSVAILTGKETQKELELLGEDIFTYFGLGCRNISKLFIPENFDIPSFMENLAPFSKVTDNKKYKNNLDYNLTLLLMNKQPHFANEFLVMQQNEAISSPVSVVHYEKYNTTDEILQKTEKNHHQIQCIVCHQKFTPEIIPPGHAQKPQLWDYADNINTLNFLVNNINH